MALVLQDTVFPKHSGLPAGWSVSSLDFKDEYVVDNARFQAALAESLSVARDYSEVEFVEWMKTHYFHVV